MKRNLLVFLGLVMALSLFNALKLRADDDSGDETPPPAFNVTVAPPVVTAELVGRLLRVTASPGFYEVESIYVNGRRFNHRVDSTLILDVGEYIALERAISIYAIDFAGNRSNVLMLSPPPHVSPATLSPEGEAGIVDNILADSNIEFFTFQTASGNWLHLVVDRNRRFNNVYLLSPVNELELMEMALRSGLIVEGEPLPTPPPAPTPTPTPTPEATPVPEPVVTPMNPLVRSVITLVIIVAVLGGVAAGYYFLKIKPKAGQKNNEDDDDGDYADGDEDEDDMIEE